MYFLMCHVSRFTCHMSCVMCHLSHVTFFPFFFWSLKIFYKVVELVGGGSVINGAYPVQFLKIQRNFNFLGKIDWSMNSGRRWAGDSQGYPKKLFLFSKLEKKLYQSWDNLQSWDPSLHFSFLKCVPEFNLDLDINLEQSPKNKDVFRSSISISISISILSRALKTRMCFVVQSQS